MLTKSSQTSQKDGNLCKLEAHYPRHLDNPQKGKPVNLCYEKSIIKRKSFSTSRSHIFRKGKENPKCEKESRNVLESNPERKCDKVFYKYSMTNVSYQALNNRVTNIYNIFVSSSRIQGHHQSTVCEYLRPTKTFTFYSFFTMKDRFSVGRTQSDPQYIPYVKYLLM